MEADSLQSVLNSLLNEKLPDYYIDRHPSNAVYRWDIRSKHRIMAVILPKNSTIVTIESVHGSKFKKDIDIKDNNAFDKIELILSTALSLGAP